jgi:hypothetical protein
MGGWSHRMKISVGAGGSAYVFRIAFSKSNSHAMTAQQRPAHFNGICDRLLDPCLAGDAWGSPNDKWRKVFPLDCTHQLVDCSARLSSRVHAVAYGRGARVGGKLGELWLVGHCL